MNEKSPRLPGAKIEMPVQLALMIARDESAVAAFDSLSPARREEYFIRARRATSAGEMRSVVEDIKTIR